MTFTGERVVPFDSEQKNWVGVLQHHIARYNFALQFAANRNVVDLGCGTGYGTHLLSFVSNCVTGIDISSDAIAFARENFTPKKVQVEFRVDDIEAFNVSKYPDHLIVCFETLEHLRNPEWVMGNLWANDFVISLPVNSATEYHKHIYSQNMAQEFMFKFGAQIWYQSSEGVITKEEPACAMYVIGAREKKNSENNRS
jgi:SAM-dependent methyltransferase